MIDFMGVFYDTNIATLYRYKDKHCEICESLKKGKEVVDKGKNLDEEKHLIYDQVFFYQEFSNLNM